MGKLLASSLTLVFFAATLFLFTGTSIAREISVQVSSQASTTKTAAPANKAAPAKKSKKRRRSRRKTRNTNAATRSNKKRYITVKGVKPLNPVAASSEKEQPAAPSTASATAPAPGPAAPNAPAATPGTKVNVSEVRHWSNAGYTRVVVALDGPITYTHSRLKDPDRLFLDIKNARITPPLKDGPISEVNDGILKTVRASQFSRDTVRVVLDLASIADYKMLMLPDPPRLVVDVTGKEAMAREARPRVITLRPVEQPKSVQAAQPQSAPAEAQPPAPAATQVTGQVTAPPNTQSAAGQPSQAQTEKPAPMFGQSSTTAPAKPGTAQSAPARKEAARPGPMYCIGTIVIDPGHGGKDTGAVGHGGLKEKDVVLDIGLRLREIIKDALGCRVVMTRDTDVFVDLDARPAKEKDADIFISIHANASRDKAARGIETYLLNTTKDRHIMELAARENMMDVERMGDLGVILKDLVLDTKREGSLRLAHAVHGKLVDEMKGANNALNNRDVRQGPFWVLYGAEMPSILTEVGFITNSEEEQLLASPDYRRKLAWAIFDGIKDYINSTRVASSGHRPAASASSY